MKSLSSVQLSHVVTDKQNRILGANALQLVEILSEELLDILEEIHRRLKKGRRRDLEIQRVSAQTILESLIVSMDNEDDISHDLRLIFRQTKQLIALPNSRNSIRDIKSAREILRVIFKSQPEVG